MRLSARAILCAAACSCLPVSAVATAGDKPEVKPLSVEWNARLRHEFVDDENFSEEASASTLRLRAGLRAAFGSGWAALVEGEAVLALGDQYNSGTNGQTSYPAVIDPAGIELNQAWLGWRDARFAATVGRQRFKLDNQRWVGNSGWRQNEQTFDAVALEWMPTPQWTARYLWLDRVHRVNGDDARDVLARERNLDTHVLDLASVRASWQWGGYLIAHEDRDVPGASSLTLGLRLKQNSTANPQGWGWRADIARQTDYGNSELRFSHAYWLLEPWAKFHGVTFRAGWEHLGGNGTHALQTPLASLHPFNGWADKFLVTPASGLDDHYVGATGAVSAAHPKWLWALELHDYRADAGDQRYGSETDASLAFPLGKTLTGLVKLADFHAGDVGKDAQKIWLQLEWTH